MPDFGGVTHSQHEPSGRDRQYPARPIVGVGAVIVVRDADRERVPEVPPLGPAEGVVLVKRRFEPLAGQWSLPGGAVELGETLEAAIAREILEETGLAVEVGPIVEVLDRICFDQERRVQYHFVLVDYLCRPAGGRLRPGSDVSDAVVADCGELHAFHLSDMAGAVIERALAMSRAQDARR